jgi:hypothetical protein
MWADDSFEPKEVFIGVKGNADRAAFRKSTLAESRVLSAPMDGRQVSVLYDSTLDAGRVFITESNGRALRLRPGDEPNVVTDSDSGDSWHVDGTALGDTAGPLEALSSYDVMWFSWVAFYPMTKVVA